jgi:hypothetical protein
MLAERGKIVVPIALVAADTVQENYEFARPHMIDGDVRLRAYPNSGPLIHLHYLFL